jgi:hypothetical protein
LPHAIVRADTGIVRPDRCIVWLDLDSVSISSGLISSSSGLLSTWCLYRPVWSLPVVRLDPLHVRLDLHVLSLSSGLIVRLDRLVVRVAPHLVSASSGRPWSNGVNAGGYLPREAATPSYGVPPSQSEFPRTTPSRPPKAFSPESALISACCLYRSALSSDGLALSSGLIVRYTLQQGGVTLSCPTTYEMAGA